MRTLLITKSFVEVSGAHHRSSWWSYPVCALGIAFWLVRNDSQGLGGTVVVVTLLLYDAGVVGGSSVRV